MAIDYEKICDEWMVYISTLDLESRKAKFKEYLEASGVYDLDSSTIFYLSEYNNFLTEGITTLLHDKAQQAKKSGKGLAHYRHTSFALSKPDAMNIVHEYIHKKVLLHTEMVSNNITKMPNTFSWSFLFNIPEYVNNKKLLTDKEVPSLPHAKHTPKSVMTSELEETLNTQMDDEEEYSSDPFDIDVDDKQQSIDKQHIIEQLKHTLISKPLKEYSPDPYDIDENIQQYTPEPDALLSNEPITFDGIKHGSVQINGHAMSATTIIGGGDSGRGVGARTDHEGSASVAKLQQLQGSNYLDSWSKNKSKLVQSAKKSTDNESKSDYKERDRETIVIKRKVDVNESELEQEQREHGAESPNHRKAGSTIQGGYWKSQTETSEKLVHLLNDAQEHRDEIVSNMQSMNENVLNVVNMQQKQGLMDDMKTFLEQQNAAIMKVIKDANAANDGKMRANNEKTLEFEQKMDANNQKYEAKILNLENRVKAFENEVKMKNNLISQQALNLKEFEMNVNNNKDMQQIKVDILKEMQLEFETFNAKKKNEEKEKQKKAVFSNEQIMDIVDKTDEILTKLSSISKYQQQLKQQYTFINEGIDGVNNSNEKYYNQTVRKMNDFNHKMSEHINDIRIDQKTNNSNHSNAGNNNDIAVHEMVKVTNLASQLTQDMGAASMLSVMRNEYNNVRKEKEEMRGEVERYRRENEVLSLRKQELEEEAINVRESKRRTIKNLVDEINEMRDQIFRLSKQNQLK